MTPVAAQPFLGAYRAVPVPSSFAFAVRHSGVFWYRGSLSDVAATLRGDGDALALEGSARVDSISVVEPAAMRASVLGPEFFDAERNPEITFRSTAVRLADDGAAEVDASSRSGASPAPSPPAVTTSHRARAASVRSRACSSGRASTAANSGSTGRWNCRAAATRSAGTSRSTSICCSSERTRAPTGDGPFLSVAPRSGSCSTAVWREAAKRAPEWPAAQANVAASIRSTSTIESAGSPARPAAVVGGRPGQARGEPLDTRDECGQPDPPRCVQRLGHLLAGHPEGQRRPAATCQPGALVQGVRDPGRGSQAPVEDEGVPEVTLGLVPAPHDRRQRAEHAIARPATAPTPRAAATPR